MTLEERIQKAKNEGDDELVGWLEDLHKRKSWHLYHPPAAEGLLPHLKPWALEMAGRFGRPVYLVGSALQLPRPRDVDVRIVLSDKEFDARWGGEDGTFNPWGWCAEMNPRFRDYAADMAKLSREAALCLRINLDFQVSPYQKAQQHRGKPRIRIDDVPGIEDVPDPDEG